MEATIMRGRYPWGPEYIDQLDGSPASKKRLKVVLQTLSGELRMGQACTELQVGDTRFHQLRQVALQAALDALEPRPAGRPSRLPTSEAEHLRRLQQRVQELERALHLAEVREEIALVLPNVQRPTGDGGTGTVAEKKMRPPRVKIRKPR
jgi:hypothetical protein